MKLFIFLAILMLGTIEIYAQDCKNIYYMTNNAKIEWTTYNEKGKEQGKLNWEISDVKESGSTLEATVKLKFKGKDNSVTKTTGKYKCENGILKADIRMSMPNQEGVSYESGGGKLEGVYLEYPPTMAVGQTLNGGDFKFEIGTNGDPLQKDPLKRGLTKIDVSFKIENRKVIGKENVTTPVGTWEAFIITYDGTYKSLLTVLLNTKEWFVPGVGIVKTETYGKKGN